MTLRRETICQLQTMVDHLTGEEIGQALCALNDHPAILDALCLHGIGKKNRPIMLLQVLCQPADEDEACQEIFRHTHTLGIRIQHIERVTLPREATSVDLGDHALAAKAYWFDGIKYVRPEADAIGREMIKAGLGAPAWRFAWPDRRP